MKRILACLFSLMSLCASAQITLNESGVYEKTVVEQFGETTAATLYSRALEGLSDFAGEGKSSIGVDYKDKETATIIFKGRSYLGFKKVMGGAGWNVWSELTLKIRCKDGRAQITVIVPSMYFEYNASAARASVPLAQIVPEVTYKGLYLKKAAQQYVVEIPADVDKLISAVKEKMNKEVDDF